MANPKEQARLAHKLIVLGDLIIDTLDTMEADGFLANEIREDTDKVKDHFDKLLTKVFNISSVKSSTYLQELSNKVDTVIRRNYKPMQ